MKDICPIALPRVHEHFMKFFYDIAKNKHTSRILDAGGGHGAFSKRLYENGYKNLAACDLFPDKFYFPEIPCHYAKLSEPLPYEDSHFDYVLAVEVMEHISSHQSFFNEAYRILKPGGKLLISTPNIVSLKSRKQFLIKGFFYSFKSLEYENRDGLQHVSSVTPDQFNYFAKSAGFSLGRISYDIRQNTSLLLLPIYKLITCFSRNKHFHNSFDLLTARILFFEYTKGPKESL